jgi:hypothetical protein
MSKVHEMSRSRVRTRIAQIYLTLRVLTIGALAATGCAISVVDDEHPATVVEELRIGSVSDAGPQLFDNILDVDVTESGRIHVANNGSGQVRVFDSTGAFVVQFARRGQGPGEFRMLNDIWTFGDSTVVIDWQGGGRGSFFDAEGRHVVSWKSTQPDGSDYLVVARDGNGWLAVNSVAPRPPFEPNAPLMYIGRYLHMDSTASSIVRAGWDRPGTTRLFAASGEGGLDWPLFEPMVGGVTKGNGLQYLIPDPLKYAIEVRDAENTLLRTISHDYTPYVISADEVERVKDLLDTHYELRPARPGWTELEQAKARIDARAALPMVSTQTPFGKILAGHDGEVWVERPDRTRTPARIAYDDMYATYNRMPGMEELPTTWDRFDPTGRFMGSVQLPVRFTAHAVWRERVIGVLRDDNDVEFVVRFRVGP